MSYCSVRTAFIEPAPPWQYGFIESFIAQFRQEQLSGEIMDTMAETKYLANDWKDICNQERLHGSLNGLSPSQFWAKWVTEDQEAIA